MQGGGQNIRDRFGTPMLPVPVGTFFRVVLCREKSMPAQYFRRVVSCALGPQTLLIKL